MGVVTIPEDFGLVAIVVVVSYVVNHLFMPFGVVSARKKCAPSPPFETSEACPAFAQVRGHVRPAAF